jgi:hypothetical protein
MICAVHKSRAKSAEKIVMRLPAYDRKTCSVCAGTWSNRIFTFWHPEASKEITREPRKGIVARAHDYNAITATGQSDQHVATGSAIWKGKGLSAASVDFTNNIVAADAAIDGAAEINRRGHD